RQAAQLGDLHEKFDLRPFVHAFNSSTWRRTKLLQTIFFTIQGGINVTSTRHPTTSGDNPNAQSQ
ncbi:hypothetical protein, partial [Burkholderia sp. LMG 13014]|uniref:hypothetical protein n=1 Tax=Burkholderia sp. LMG 13014 TaxID=2709306 RepID=UPI0019661A48